MTNSPLPFLSAAAAAVTLLREPAVAEHWHRPSALPEFGVAGLAGHLASQLHRVEEVLLRSDAAAGPAAGAPADSPAGAPAGGVETIPLREHYRRSAWVGADIDSEANTRIRAAGEAGAEGGPQAVADAAAAALDRIAAALPAVDLQQPVLLPWAGWALSGADFLFTRILEIAVHDDDLAVSVGITAPELPAEVVDPVLALLHELAVARHGRVAVLRALSRAERAPQSIAAI